jgi:hypothetical protein
MTSKFTTAEPAFSVEEENIIFLNALGNSWRCNSVSPGFFANKV